jgi:type I restriction enzyme R subunit
MAKLSTGAKTIEREDGSEVELTTALDKKRRIDTAYEVYLGLYQAITGPEDRQKPFREFSPGFFDLIVIDECHRGSAADDAAWRESSNISPPLPRSDLRPRPKKPSTFRIFIILGRRFKPTRSGRVSKTASCRHTR